MTSLRIVIAWTLVALAACQSSGPAATGPTTQKLKFGLCDAEGFRALNTARQYLVLKDSKDHIRSYLGTSPNAQAFMQDFFTRADAGQIKSHAVFAAEKLYACADREGLNIGKPRAVAEACYARADIPFFLVGVKANTPGKREGVRKVEAILKDRTLYPEPLITATADAVYSSPAPDTQKLMGTVFWSCVYNQEWTAKR